METTLKQRAEALAASLGWSIARLQIECNLSNAYFVNVGNITNRTAKKIQEKIPNVNIEFLKTGKGKPLLEENDTVDLSSITVPLVPVSAQGGSLNDFECQVEGYDCERILSPVKDATLAITISGDSMSPEYPNGCRVLVKKIDDEVFVEWGCAYVLDTKNGAVMKNIHPCPDDNTCITCRSVNPNYEPFRIKKTDIRGWYKVLMQMSLK